MTTDKLKITDEEALEYHRRGNKPGKVSLNPTKPLVTQKDLSLAYSPGVAAPCKEILKEPDLAYDYTSKGNCVAVVSNGSAVLGLGNLGAAASKPVMEGKSVLFKRFADIDATDLEVDTQDPREFIDTVKRLGASWGGVNLEDIKAPDCFIIERELKKAMDIPVFHDDQHGTAIITAAGLINASHITGKKIEDMKVVLNGPGAAGIACVELLKSLGIANENVILCDRKGVIHTEREDKLDEHKSKHAVKTDKRTLLEAVEGADVLVGLSVEGAFTKEMISKLAADPIIFAMANPNPEIMPEAIKEVRDDAIIATGRSDYNNQVNNVMGFPYIFRGALDVHASTINEEMKIAAAKSIAQLARQPVPEQVYKAYAGRKMQYGREYIIPVPFDPRLITTIPVAVAKAAIKSGVARRKIKNIKEYKRELEARLDPSATSMNLIYEQAASDPQRVVFAEGEEEETIKSAINMRNNSLAKPVLIGRHQKIYELMRQQGIDDSLEGIEILNAAVSEDVNHYIDHIYVRLQRRGYLYRDCARLVKRDKNVFAACVVKYGHGDALVTGLTKSYHSTLNEVRQVIDNNPGHIVFGYSLMVSKHHKFILADSSINELPSSKELADISMQTAEIAQHLGYNPRVALLSFSNFGNPMREKTERIREAVQILESRKPKFEFDGEMAASTALNKELLKLYPFCRLSAPANVLIMPALHTAHISSKLLQEVAGGTFIGPVLTGLEVPVQIVPMRSSADVLTNLASFAAVESIKNQKKQ
jgi:malate dehydrogenase (oxaloacetate-decarboxylating)(NADP+)